MFSDEVANDDTGRPAHLPHAIADVFAQVLLICNQQGLIGHELIALDGCRRLKAPNCCGG